MTTARYRLDLQQIFSAYRKQHFAGEPQAFARCTSHELLQWLVDGLKGKYGIVGQALSTPDAGLAIV